MPSRSDSSQRRTDYSTTPLVRKLGIKPGSDVAVDVWQGLRFVVRRRDRSDR